MIERPDQASRPLAWRSAARWPAPEDGYGPLRGMIEQRMAHRVASLRLDRRVDQRTYATREGPHTFGGRCESRVRLQPERRAGQRSEEHTSELQSRSDLV